MSQPQHMTDETMDQNYIQKMRCMSLNGSGDADPESPYGRIRPGKPETAFHQKQRSMGAIESFSVDGPAPQKPPGDYKMYERTNIIAASKFATPKPVETMTMQQDIYVQCNKPRGPPSPETLSNSSQHSESPRASVDYGQQPVYENVEYYQSRGAAPPYFHQLPREGVYESTYRKAQPQVPPGSRQHPIPPEEGPPVYENIHELQHRSSTSGAQPGPQVARYAQQQIPQMATASYFPQKSLTPQELEEINGSDYVCMTGNVSISHQTLSINAPSFQTTHSNSYDREPISGTAGEPKPIVKEKPKEEKKAPPSPTPSAASTVSAGNIAKPKMNYAGFGPLMSGKALLPYNVTPPKRSGPSEAERKIEEMTRQLEEEMEKQEEEGEYFGKF